VILTGAGCEWVQDWSLFVKAGIELEESSIKRLDIALTTFKGQVTDSMIVQAHADGRFNNRCAPPAMRSITSSDARAGITRYIGKRENHKFLRCYEKGFEMIKDVPVYKERISHINGDKVEDIYRVELELKAVDKLIPWESILGRDQVFAGAYPFCADLLPGVPHWVMKTLPQDKAIFAAEKALTNIQKSYGGAIRVLYQVFNGDAEALLAAVMATEPSRALVEAGVLTLEPYR
jgi:DNA relaxase NicK